MSPGTPCSEFRARLARALRRSDADAPLAWHEHVLGCAACRALLAEERALELLLATFPTPRLPRDLASRVLARLARERELPESDLEQLLGLAVDVAPPSGLVSRVLAELSGERDAERLERVLERVPSPSIPAELAARTLARLAPARRGARFVLLRGRLVALAAAAGLVALALLAWKRWQARSASPAELAPAPLVVFTDEELLEHLEVLENWKELHDPELDLLLASLALDEQVLLQYSDAEDLEEPADASAEPERKNG